METKTRISTAVRLLLGLLMLGASVLLSAHDRTENGGQVQLAAIAATAVINKPQYRSWNVTCLDADTGPTAFNHGFKDKYGANVAPDDVDLQELISAAASPNWARTVTSTQIILSKQSAAGSGGGTPGTTVVLKVVALAPHTIME